MRTTLESQLHKLQADNASKLEQMRATVDEKLQYTLNTRLDASFKLVSERLEAVQRGLGEIDRKSVVEGTSVSVRVDLGGRRTIKNRHHKTIEKNINVKHLYRIR